MLVKTDGRIYYFDRGKCEKNFKMGREGATTKWTSIYRKAGQKKDSPNPGTKKSETKNKK